MFTHTPPWESRPESPFIARLKQAVTSSPTSPIVLLANFEVEEVWARDETTLPRFGSAHGAAIVNRMDEFAIWLGTSVDTVLLKESPDPEFLADIDAQGFDLPTILAVDKQSPALNVTRDVATDSHLVATCRALSRSGSVLLSHSVSELETALASDLELALASPSAEICKAVNGKVYSRHLADAHDIRQPSGVATGTVEDWHAAVEWARQRLRDGRCIVVKEAYGVSGKGIAVVRSESRLDRIASLVTERAERNGGRALFSVEEWLDKDSDLNYQFTIGRDGGHRFDFVKVAATARGVHLGHSYPSSLADAHLQEIHSTSARIATALAADGYFGVVGVDAIIDTAGMLYPMLEINARFNMSTYQAKIDELVDEQSMRARAKHYDLRLSDRLPYALVRCLLDELIYSRTRRSGLIINNFATVNAAFPTEKGRENIRSLGEIVPASTPGRLYGVLIGETEKSIHDMDAEITRRLATVETRTA